MLLFLRVGSWAQPLLAQGPVPSQYSLQRLLARVEEVVTRFDLRKLTSIFHRSLKHRSASMSKCELVSGSANVGDASELDSMWDEETASLESVITLSGQTFCVWPNVWIVCGTETGFLSNPSVS